MFGQVSRRDNLNRHTKTCTRARTNIACPGNRILAPESAFEKAFYPEASFGIRATCWLENEARQRGIHIHHHRCGHGGERTIVGQNVDGLPPRKQNRLSVPWLLLARLSRVLSEARTKKRSNQYWPQRQRNNKRGSLPKHFGSEVT